MMVVPLRHRPEFISQLADWHDREWRHLYHVWNRETAMREFPSEPRDGRLPQTLLAMDSDRLIGSVSLVFNDLPGREDLNPWVASFFVIASERGHGVGGRLLAAAEEVLRTQRIRQAYLFTETAQRFFEKHDWTAHETADANGHKVLVMTKQLADNSLSAEAERVV
jgi:GNAT superfamily N-acetyltransferase